MRCTACHKDNASGAEFCDFCKSPLLPPERRLQQTDLVGGEVVADAGFAPGSVIANRYLVVRELGRGGMGVVYLVQDQQLRGKDVALKLISASLTANENARERFVQEVLAAQELSHPNIVKVFHLDQWNGQSFFTMEYVPGRSLREILEARKQEGRLFTLEEAQAILIPVLNALHHAHTQPSQVIHRDIKPDNIIVAGKFPSPQVKVLDFGLAKMCSTSKLTATAVSMGTAYYMAPEQMKDVSGVDVRTDLFAVGVMLYEMLTGEIPTGRFKLPSQVRSDLPVAIDVIVDKALQPDLADRFGEAVEFSNALQVAGSVNDSTVSQAELRQEQPLPQPGPPARPSAKRWLLVGVVLVLVLGGVLAVLRGLPTESQQVPVEQSGFAPQQSSEAGSVEHVHGETRGLAAPSAQPVRPVPVQSSAQAESGRRTSSSSVLLEVSGQACGNPQASRQDLKDRAYANAKEAAMQQVKAYLTSLAGQHGNDESSSKAVVHVLEELAVNWEKGAGSGDEACCKVLLKVEVAPNRTTEVKAAGKVLSAMSADGPLQLELWTGQPEYRLGDRMTFYFRGNKAFYAHAVYQDATGTLVEVTPYARPRHYKPGITYKIPGEGDDFALEITPPLGREKLTLYASTQPLGKYQGQGAGDLLVLKENAKKLGATTRGLAVLKNDSAPVHAEFAEVAVDIRVRE